MQEDPENPYSYHHHGAGTISGGGGSSRVVVRGRGCNESFRAAVDRSYEAPLGLAEFRSRMETLAEEDNDGPGGMNRVGSDRGGGPVPSGPFLMRGSSRQSSLGAEGISKKGIREKQSKKGSASSSAGSGGILKGIGSMFRFGKHRKTVEIPTQVVREKEVDEVMGEREDGVENPVDVPGVQGRSVKEGSTNERPADSREREREQARMEAQEEQQRIQEQYRRLMQRQRQIEQQQQQSERDMGPPEGGDLPYHHPMHGPQQGHHGVDGGMDGGSSRAERIQQLRAQHQRRHAERRGQYPMDDREERYEEAIRQSLDHHLDSIGNERIRSRLPQGEAVHYGRGGSSVIRMVDDIRGSEVVSTDMEGGSRPESRMGPPSDPAQFSHYVNYEEIQQHLSRRQQHYHSQRRDNRDSPFHHARPVSNFYEYESVLQGTGGAIGHQHNHHQLLMRRQVVAEENMRQVGVAWQQPQRVEGGSLPKRLGGTGGSVGRISGGNYLQPRIYQPASAPNSALKSQGYLMGASQRSSGMQHHPMQSPQKHDGRQSSHHGRTGSSGLMGHSQQSSWRGPYVSTTRIRPTESSPPGSKV
ncbi:hypothetical protein J437_LFUL006954 [Ladona fulva]|uniref:Uncharacterized protein n=1 Tax=Ladona fulva TaxID=123851 RepID=A0A8K0KFB9_LADFU|nr:hypothetical protein J437_LFUL006954 [Ladona fulva]